jgi:hypothetical protein
MTTKRIGRLLIVLFLLAALPGLTAVMAQGQEPPAEQPLPPVMEPTESQALLANRTESEPNNTIGQADVMSINDVMAGTITTGDVDFFKFFAAESVQTLIDIDAATIGSNLNSVVSIFNADGLEMWSSDNTDTTDPMFKWTAEAGWYYLRVGASGGGSTGNYNLIVSSPLLISAAAANLGTGYVAGIPFRSEDILAWSDLNTNEEKWVLLVDGSDVGWTNLTNLTELWGHISITVGFATNTTLQRLGGGTFVATPWDAVMYRLEQVGGNTVATCQCDVHSVFFGQNLSLSTVGEKIDAISLDGHNWDGGPGDTLDLYVSTVGTASVPKPGGGILKPADEDVFLNQMTTESNPWFNKYQFFDGSRVAGLAVEDIVAMEYDRTPSTMFLTILGPGRIAGHPVTQKDIFAISMPGHTWGGVVWHGPDHGWNYNIDAIDYPGW